MKGKRKRRILRSKEGVIGWLFVFPYIGYNAIFWIFPFVWGFVLALSRWNYLTPRRFVGLKNFFRLFYDPVFLDCTRNTFNFMLYFIPSVLACSLFLAILLNRVKYFKGFFSLGFLLAYVSSGVAYSLTFSMIFADYGPINNFLFHHFNFTIPWFSSPQLAMLSIVIVVVWKMIGYYGMILLAGLQSIPESVYEAAELDGANSWTKFWKITIPLLNPAITTIMVLAIILSFGIFTEPFMITEGGPMRRTYSFMLMVYINAFSKLQAGYASALALVIAALSFSCVWVVRKLIEREVSLT